MCHSHTSEMGLVFNTLCPIIFCCYNKIPEMFSGKLFWLTALKTGKSVCGTSKGFLWLQPLAEKRKASRWYGRQNMTGILSL